VPVFPHIRFWSEILGWSERSPGIFLWRRSWGHRAPLAPTPTRNRTFESFFDFFTLKGVGSLSRPNLRIQIKIPRNTKKFSKLLSPTLALLWYFARKLVTMKTLITSWCIQIFKHDEISLSWSKFGDCNH